LHQGAVAGAIIEEIGQLAEQARRSGGPWLFLVGPWLRVHGRATFSAMPV
jgi:hypothetical protein